MKKKFLFSFLWQSCGQTECTKIICTVWDLAENDKVYFTIRSRLWQDTIRVIDENVFHISSKLVALVTSLPYDFDPSLLHPEIYSVITKVHTAGRLDKTQLIPLWKIILAVICGLLILGLLALLLWKVGLFRIK